MQHELEGAIPRQGSYCRLRGQCRVVEIVRSLKDRGFQWDESSSKPEREMVRPRSSSVQVC